MVEKGPCSSRRGNHAMAFSKLAPYFYHHKNARRERPQALCPPLPLYHASKYVQTVPHVLLFYPYQPRARLLVSHFASLPKIESKKFRKTSRLPQEQTQKGKNKECYFNQMEWQKRRGCSTGSLEFKLIFLRSCSCQVRKTPSSQRQQV
jgi:hypothetical protein